EIRDFELSPSEITVKVGEIVRFVVVNTSEHVHEMVLGTMKELEDHNEMMKQHPGMHHDEPHMAHVAPGKSGVIVWQFTKPGEFYFGCLIDDHFEVAGMFGKIRVTGQPASGGASQPMDHSSMDHSTGKEHQSSEMLGMYGGYPMSRESSGTSWQPEASPHQGIHAMYGGWSTTTHGLANLIHDR